MIVKTAILTSVINTDRWASIDEWIGRLGNCQTDNPLVEEGTLELISETEVKRTLTYASESNRALHKIERDAFRLANPVPVLTKVELPQ
jgi:hypothetical protein